MVFIVPTAQFYLTNVGKAAALDAANNSINIEVTKIAIGTAKYNGQVAAPAKTALTTEVGRYNLVGGGSSGQVLRLTTTLTPNYTAEIFEIGLFLSDGTLFAVAAVTGTDPLMQTANGLTSVITLGCSLAEVGSNVTVSVDANSPIAVVLMNQHIKHSDPHPQYVRHSDKASTTQAGIVQLDNQDFGELISSTNKTKAVTPKQLGETNKLVAQRIFFGQTSTDIVQSDNSNTFIRIFGGDGIVGGSTQIKGSGNVTVSTDSEGIGYLNIHGALNNSLTSTATNEALTARQGKILKDLIDQLDVSGKYDKTGGELNGNILLKGYLELTGGRTVAKLYAADFLRLELNRPLLINGAVNVHNVVSATNLSVSDNGGTTIKHSNIEIEGNFVRFSSTRDKYVFDKPVFAPNINVYRGWYDLTASRALNTPYTNDTNSDIDIIINFQDNHGKSPLAVIVGGTTLIDVLDFGASGTFPVTFTVPSGYGYTVNTAANGVNTIRRWSERREV